MLPESINNRKYGIEIECFGISITAGVQALENAGIRVTFAGYTHRTFQDWKIVTDASVSDGFEVVSPVLQGDSGLEEIRRVAVALRAAGAKVDRRCGFHVHVDARDLTPADLSNAVRRYAHHEATIDSFMPRSRRGNYNTYCQSTVSLAAVLARTSSRATTAEMVRASRSGNEDIDRRVKLNIFAFLRHGTIEFRQHSGTLDPRKMISWITFCLMFIQDSRVMQSQIPLTFLPSTSTVVPPTVSSSTTSGSTLTAPTPTGTAATARLRPATLEKMRLLAEAMESHRGRYNFITALDLAVRMNVTEASVPSYISRFRSLYGIEIFSRRNRGYYRGPTSLLTAFAPLLSVTQTAVTPSVPAPTAITHAPNPDIFASLDRELVSYFQERIMELA